MGMSWRVYQLALQLLMKFKSNVLYRTTQRIHVQRTQRK